MRVGVLGLTWKIAEGQKDQSMTVAGFVDVFQRHVLETLRIPAQLAVVTGVIARKSVEVWSDSLVTMCKAHTYRHLESI